jgi:hypothetical protein
MAMKMGPVWLVESCCAEAAIFVRPNWLQLELGMQKFYLSFYRFLLAVFFNLFSRASQMPHSSVQSSPLCDLELFTGYVWARLEIQEIFFVNFSWKVELALHVDKLSMVCQSSSPAHNLIFRCTPCMFLSYLSNVHFFNDPVYVKDNVCDLCMEMYNWV